MAELLLELFSEEIPARMQARAAEDLKRLVTDKLKEAGLTWEKADAFASPRRLTLVVDGLPTTQPDTVEERKGPRADAPEKAIDGFLKSVGLTRDAVEERDTDKGKVLFAVIKKTGRPTAEVVADFLPAVVHGLPWPKSMRWADGSLRWVRPLQSILGVFDGKALDVAIEGIKVSNQTRGHRFLSPEPFAVKDFADYQAKLQKAHVLLDAQDRKAKIMADAKLLAADAGLSLIEDNALLDEVAGLVEWPVALLGSFDPAFLDVPAEVLTATMRANQKYFSLVHPKTGKLAPKFIVIANMETKDKGKAIIAGNERVLKARLSDAKFFWDQDLKIKLEDRVPALDGIVFHAKLGSAGDKVKRVVALAEYLAPLVGADVNEAKRAAYLAKADLVSGVVGEFPEVQGIMGRYYALRQGEPAAVADAIADHYSPKGPDDKCPTAPVSIAVALADKIDTLVGFFGIDEKPTGSKDPFALRRAALGVIRLIVENELRLNLEKTNRYAASVLLEESSPAREHILNAWFSPQPGEPQEVKGVDIGLAFHLSGFFADRLKVQQREKGVRHDLIDAVFSLGGEDDLVRLINRVQALQQMLATEDGANLLAAYRRGSNIVTIEEKKDKRAYTGGAIGERLKLPEEQALYQKLLDVKARVAAAVAHEQWIEAMTAVAALRAPIDAFFDKVTVNDADATLRENRLNLLAEFRATLSAVADFSKIEG
ncbi:MAG: glycine--tRNA ligase subunit beta [Sphingomonadales bacterium]|nr:glycine--tRNA ligase subunit beta [Sphingomonadales bacterium]